MASCRNELSKRVIGQKNLVDGLLSALIAGGHVLLEGVPGLAKTLAVKTLADLTGLSFKRVQFTPDLLPADLTGTLIYDQSRGTFTARRGPVFANIVLADEINRAPAKVQSALLEAMEEGQVTIGDESLSLPTPFFVLATQNPIEHEGTYALPEAELDRFMVKIRVSYPTLDEEMSVVRLTTEERPSSVDPVLDAQALASLRRAAEAVACDERVMRYLVSVVSATRPPLEGGAGRRKGHREDLYRYVQFGASPRASIAIFRLARVRALFEGRSYLLPEDVKIEAPGALRHRLSLSYEAEADGVDADEVIARLLSFIPLP